LNELNGFEPVWFAQLGINVFVLALNPVFTDDAGIYFSTIQ